MKKNCVASDHVAPGFAKLGPHGLKTRREDAEMDKEIVRLGERGVW